MATFNVTGIESIIKDLQRMGDEAQGVAEKMLFAGADVMVWHWQSQIQAAGHIDTGAMIRSVRPDKAVKEKDGVLQLTVYPRGSDSTGTRNAEKAFIAHYGRTRQQGSGFVTKAIEAGEGQTWSAMESAWDQFIAQR